MKNKSTIITLLIIFSVICAFNLFYTYQAFSMDAEYQAAPDSVQAKMDENATRRKSLQKAQRNAFSLGLDLQGGMLVTLEVDVEDVLRTKADIYIDDMFDEAMDSAKAIKQESQASLVDIFYEELVNTYKRHPDEPGHDNLMAYYFDDENLGIQATTPDEEVVAKLKQLTEDAIANTFDNIRTRVDRFGVANPNIQQETGTGRIILELPGVRQPERVIDILQSTARLEFFETKTYAEAYNVLKRINQAVRRIEGLEAIEKEGQDSANAAADTSKVDTAANAVAVAEPVEPAVVDPVAEPVAEEPDTTKKDTTDTSGTALPAEVTSSLADLNTPEDSAANDSAEAQMSQEEYLAANPFLGRLTMFRNANVNATPLVGLVKLSDTARINDYLANPEVEAVIPSSIRFMWESKPDDNYTDDGGEYVGLIAIAWPDDDKAPLSGEHIVEARQEFEPMSTKPMVTMAMDAEGREAWARITKNNIGRSVAIVMDGYVLSFPTVNGVIAGGRSQISGGFSLEEAQDLAVKLKAGALPVKVNIIGQNQVGPTLGAENLSKGLFSFLIAFIATICFMLFYYTSSGLVANVALLVNLFFILGVSAAFNVVFTLPGLAAVVLTMGMAVDANVLIFERIREEQNAGKSFKAAIQAGFSNAFSSVMDANITTFLTGLILFSFGLGPIKGFAVSLMIGILTSLISALFITRIILEYFANKGRDSIKFGSKMTQTAFSKVNINMTKRKNVFYIVSGLLIAGSIASITMNGFKTGVDLEGGRQYKVEFAQSVSPEQVRDPLSKALGNSQPLVRTLDVENSLLITTSYLSRVDSATPMVTEMVMTALNEAVPNSQPTIVETMSVGPTVAKDIRRSAIYSIIFSLLIIFVYILVRFRKPQYSLGAIAALFHDVIIVLGITSLLGALDILPFRVEVDQAFIAAVLTIIGYSINDTVVVFDRIRENLGEMKSSDLSTVYDTSINQTISRTLITSLTTLVTVLILFIFGGEAIQGFMFALIVGIIVGTYSSIFVASPISHDLILSGQEAQKAKKGK